MSENIPIKKDIYSSNKFREVIDTNFSELFGVRETFSIEEFFGAYNELFLEIPIDGELSHRALIRKSSQLITPGKDAKDKEIDALQAMLEDLQNQLLEANTPDTTVIREHPLFPNGSLIARLESSPHFPDLFYMDQGYKRGVDFSGNNEQLKSLKSLTGYTDKEVPRFPDNVIDGVPNGDNLSLNNINIKWNPPEQLAESEQLRIILDPTDANLNIDKYDGNYERYKSELEKDFDEKTNYINGIENKIEDITNQIQNITGG